MPVGDSVDELVSVYLQARNAGAAPRPEELCRDRPELLSELRRRIRVLEAFDRVRGAHEDTSDHQDLPSTSDQSTEPKPNGLVGRYRLLECLGEGGMGAVYLAQQDEPVRRRVAVKLIRQGRLSSQAVARFEAERQALALMDHPNIAKVLDAGATPDGQPYFVMELVKGVPITRFCDDQKLTVRERLELFVPVCRAVQHAHQKGIIHRDLKPSNVLVTLADGRPVPKVIDFGVAKAIEQPLTDRTLHTQVGTVVGTWEYMSPEQAEAGPLGVDTRTDVYSLGVLLYELLTGSTPLAEVGLRGRGITEMIRTIREVEPPRPSARLSSVDTPAAVASARRVEPAQRLAGLVRGELDWVVMRSLAKNRAERYETPNELGDDVARYLAGEPVRAVPPSLGYRFKKFLRRNKAAVAAGTAVLLALVLGVVVSTWQAVRAQTERDHARASERQLQHTLTRQVADRMEADLRRLAAVGKALAALLEEGGLRDEARLTAWKLRALADEPQIYGLCVAFEPGTVDLRPENDPGRVGPWPGPGERDGYSRYVYHKPTHPKPDHPNPIRPKPVAEALTPDYDYRHQEWYETTLKGQRRGWTEPFYDRNAGNTWMVSYTAPIHAQNPRPLPDLIFDQRIGVLTVDLSLDYFQQLGDWLRDLNFGEKSYGFVITGSGRVIRHPEVGLTTAALADGTKAKKLGEVFPDPAFEKVLHQILTHTGDEVGQALGTDPARDRLSRFLYARFDPGWFFVAVIPEEPR